MNFLRAFLGIAITVVLALLLGKTEKFKSPAAYTYCWIASITVLLLLRWCL